MYYIIIKQSRHSPLVWWSKAMLIIHSIQHIYEYHARARESRMKNNCFSRLTLWVPTLQRFYLNTAYLTTVIRGGNILNCTHQYWVKIDAVHVQPLDFIQEIQLGDCRHLTPTKWLSLSNHKK